MSWQPIDTAPKPDTGHGPEVLLWDGRFMHICFWDGIDKEWKDVFGALAEGTMWHPLPEPPKEDA